MSQQNIQSNSQIANNIIKVIKEAINKLIEIAEVVARIPNLIGDAIKEITQAANRVIQAKGEMEIYSRLANAVSKKELISSEQTAIVEFKEQLTSDIKVITDRYDKILGDLDAEAEKRVRKLDQAILELPDKFPSDFGKSGAQFYEVLNALSVLITSTGDPRYMEIVDLARECYQKTAKYLETRKGIAERYKEFLHITESDDEILNIPIYLIQYQTSDGHGRSKALLKPLPLTSRTHESDQMTDYFQSVVASNCDSIIEELSWDQTMSKTEIDFSKMQIAGAEINMLKKLVAQSKIATA